ncbi:glycosyltransferase [Luteibaculum oceani]|uniref:Glycosyltransferase n=1 Tax=Luteibaculum oceani TaxID=1294296 RepID=A0A5C6UZY7_9FLAO|nr:glycosyltransferase [Luteibaculum oceani]TXC78797.1 glycosyltransferase [Luteibaculum oceani]
MIPLTLVFLGTVFYILWLINISEKDSNAPAVYTGIPVPTIIVAVHNQEKELEDFINSLSAFVDTDVKAIFVFNGCTDNSEEIIRRLIGQNKYISGQFISIPEPDKKKAIEAAVDHCGTPWFWLLDCDVRFYPTQRLYECLERVPTADLIIPSLGLKTKNTALWLRPFLNFEWRLLQRITLNVKSRDKAVMCNGAHLLVSTSAFLEVKPYQNNYQFKTGDDIFLLDAFQKDGRSIVTLKDQSWCYTRGVKNYSEFLKQRIRWASKNFEFKQSHFRMAKVVVGIRMIIPFLALSQFLWFCPSGFLFCLLFIAVTESRVRSSHFLLDVFCSFAMPVLYLPVVIGATFKRFKI